jgi:hypothetical protein
MRTMLKSLLASTAFLAFTPLPASALPEQCYVVCSCAASCITRCAVGSAVVTCGFLEYCANFCTAPSGQQASVSEETETSEDASSVCTDTQPAHEASAES